jgi:GNAT superfamily N-acetyltransferase
MSDVRIRAAEPADATALTALMTRTFRETYRSDLFGICRPEDVETYVAEYFDEPRQYAELVDSAMRTLLVEVEETLAGYAQLRFGHAGPCVTGARPVELARFYVDRPWHGRGVAQSLMQACVAAAPNADPLWLGVYEHNERARAFYAKCGFVPVGRATFRMGDDVQDDWILALNPR